MTPPTITLRAGDSRQVLAEYPDDHFDSVVCDPPYDLGFMGKDWDKQGVAFETSFWAGVLRVLKPGGHLAAFGGTRTYHRMVCAIEDAGFEVRDSLHWIYGTGFPKNMDVSKAIDKAAGAEREVLRVEDRRGDYDGRERQSEAINTRWREAEGRTDARDVATRVVTEPATDDAKRWVGWGTALKPAHEPIVLARKPLAEKTVAANVLKHGTGAINVDGCRVPTTDALGGGAEKATRPDQKGNEGWTRPWMSDESARAAHAERVQANVEKAEQLGRFPANVLHDGSPEVLDGFASFGTKTSGVGTVRKKSSADQGGNTSAAYGAESRPEGSAMVSYGDSGTADRFFTVCPWNPETDLPFYYCAKASKSERGSGNTHPTVKPVALVRHLVRLVTPPGGIVLDPFLGSGTTALACRREGFGCVGVEMTPEYLAIAEARCGIAGDRRADGQVGE